MVFFIIHLGIITVSLAIIIFALSKDRSNRIKSSSGVCCGDCHGEYLKAKAHYEKQVEETHRLLPKD